jgi:steroid delta-isomerase-like uncharacterized protein
LIREFPRRRKAGMPEDNAAIMKAYYEAWNAGEPSGLDRFVADDFVGHDPAMGPDFDREGLKQRMEGLYLALQDFRLTPEIVLAQDDLVAYRWRTDGTFAQATSEVHPDGMPVSFTGITIYRLHDGRIAELWNEWDNLRFLTAIGAVPEGSVAAG